VARPDDVLEVPGRVARHLLRGVPVARAGDEGGDVDDEGAEVLECRSKARQDVLGRPDVAGRVLREGRVPGCELGLDGVRVEGRAAVDVVGALERVRLAVLELLLAAGPANEPFCLGLFERCCGG
jgi:hypothetical protein